MARLWDGATLAEEPDNCYCLAGHAVLLWCHREQPTDWTEGDRLPAKEHAGPTAAPRIAVVKLGDVLLNYTKAKESKKELDTAIAPYCKLSNQGGVVPLFIRPRLDITQAVLKTLHDAHATTK